MNVLVTAPWQEQTHAYTVVMASAASVQDFNLADNVVFARNSHCVGIIVKKCRIYKRFRTFIYLSHYLFCLTFLLPCVYRKGLA